MPKLLRRTVILAKAEATYGVDPVPGTSDGILCNMAPEVTAQGEKIERDPVRDHLSPIGHVIGAKQYNLTMEVEARGGGLSGGSLLSPEYEPLLLACALQKTSLEGLAVDDASGFTLGETVTGGTSGATGTLHFTRSGHLYLSGVSGTFQEGETVTGGSSAETATVYAQLEVAQGSGFTTSETVTGGTSSATGTVQRVDNNILILSGDSGTFQAGEAVTGGTSGTASTAKRTQQVGLAVIEYRPVSAPDSMDSATLHFHRDGIRHVALGCRGTLSLEMSVGQIPKIRFELQGLYSTPSDQTLPTPSLLDLTPAVCFDMGAKIGSHTPVATALSLALNNTLSPRKDINAEEGVTEFMVTARRPTGSINPEAPALSSFNPWSAWKSASAALVEAMAGNAPGNRLLLCVPKAVYEEVRYEDREGIVSYALPFVARMDTVGDDEIRLLFS